MSLLAERNLSTSVNKTAQTSSSGGVDGNPYRREITVQENSGSNLSNYQTLIELDNTNFDFSHSTSDGSDIRITDTSLNKLSFWIEEWDSVGETAKIWVKIPSISASSTVTLYIYYGNASLTTESDGDNTFLFFDDFSGDLSKWTGDTDYASISDGILTLTSTGADHFIFSLNNYGPSVRFRAKEQHPQASSSDAHDSESGFRTNNAWTDVVRINEYKDTTWHLSCFSGGTSGTAIVMGSLTTDWAIHQMLWVTGSAKGNIDDGTIYESTSEVPSVSIPAYFRAYATSGYTTDIKVDWVFIGNYVSSEPSVSIGSEQNVSGSLPTPVRSNAPAR